MDSTFNAFLKNATKVRLIRCFAVAVCFVILGYLLTTVVFLHENFPDVVSVLRGGRSSIEVLERDSSRKPESEVEYWLVRKGHRLGQTYDTSVDVKLLAGAPGVRNKVGLAPDVHVRSEADAGAKSDSDNGKQNEDEERDDDFQLGVSATGIQHSVYSELVRQGHELGRTENPSLKDKVLVAAPTIAAAAAPRVAREDVRLAPDVQVQGESEAVVETDSEDGGQNEDEEGGQGGGDKHNVKHVLSNGKQQSGDAELVRQGLQNGRTENSSFRNGVLAGAPTIVAVAPRVAAREEVSLAPVTHSVAARKRVRIGPVAPPIAGKREESLAPDVQVPQAGEESDSEGGEQSEDEDGDLEEEELDYFQQAIRNGTVMRVNYTAWDTRVGCRNFWKKQSPAIRSSSRSKSLQNSKVDNCTILRKQHVSVLVKKWEWIPDTLNNLYSCECGLTCLWTNSEVLEETPDAHLYESAEPPERRRKGQPWRVYMDLEPGRKRAPSQDLFVSYHAKDDIQVTYAGASFHVIRNYYISPLKHDDVLVYWSSSRCLYNRQRVAFELLEYLPHHSFGACLNNVGGPDMILHMYPNCNRGSGAGESWSQNLHCAMSHYKFVLAIENTRTESYVTEKLFYALDAGSVPIYFGAPNVLDFVPPNSIIDGSKFASMRKLAEYVKRVAADPVLYAEFHAWRRCGVMGPYGKTRAVSLDSLPCRLCAAVSKRGGRNA